MCPMPQSADDLAVLEFFIVVTVIAATLLILAIIQVAQQNKGRRKYGKSFLFSGKMKHVDGLNLPAGAKSMAYFLTDRIVLSALGQEVHIPENKISVVSVMKKQDIQKQYVSNTGAAVAGAIVGGALGALVLGAPSLRNVKTTRKNLVIGFLSDASGIAYILFDASFNPNLIGRIKRQYGYVKKRQQVRIEM